MPFIPHTQADVEDMMKVIGIEQLDALFDEIPAELVSDRLDRCRKG